MTCRLPLFLLALLLAVVPFAHAQMPGGPPPSVGVVKVEARRVTESNEFIGRVIATDRVNLTARVTAFLEERQFVEGTEVKEGDVLFRLDRVPFEVVVRQSEATLAESAAKLANTNIQLSRAQQLIGTPAGQRAALDDAIANQRVATAQTQAAQAKLRQAEIDLGYTEIKAPIAGKISRAAVTVGNVVGPASGTLATIVSQDPMYVVFPVASRVLTQLDKHYEAKGGIAAALIRLRLPDGSNYAGVGRIDYVDPSVTQNTDTIILRARIPNPARGTPVPGQPVDRALIDGSFVTILAEGPEPVAVLSLPRAAVLADQQGNYVFVVGADNKIEQRRITLGQSTPTLAVITKGVTEGEQVVLDGLQRVRPGIVVVPSPAAARAG